MYIYVNAQNTKVDIPDIDVHFACESLRDLLGGIYGTGDK
jgi:hypothetical protein